MFSDVEVSPMFNNLSNFTQCAINSFITRLRFIELTEEQANYLIWEIERRKRGKEDEDRRRDS